MRLHFIAKEITCKVPSQHKRLGLLQARHRTVPVFSASSSSPNSNKNDSGTVQWINACERVPEFFSNILWVHASQSFAMLSISHN